MSIFNQKPRESKIEKAVNAYGRSLGWRIYKFKSPSQRGVADVICFRNGKCFMIEYKRPGGAFRKLQLRFQSAMAKEKFSVWMIDNVEEGKRIFREKE